MLCVLLKVIPQQSLTLLYQAISPCGRTELPSDHGFTYRHLFFLLFSIHFYMYFSGFTRRETYLLSGFSKYTSYAYIK